MNDIYDLLHKSIFIGLLVDGLDILYLCLLQVHNYLKEWKITPIIL